MRNIKTVMITSKSSVNTVLEELTDLLIKEDVVLKIVSDEEFDLMFVDEKQHGKNYENVEIDLADEIFMKLALQAHEENITFNQLVERILKKKIGEMNGA